MLDIFLIILIYQTVYIKLNLLLLKSKQLGHLAESRRYRIYEVIYGWYILLRKLMFLQLSIVILSPSHVNVLTNLIINHVL